MFKLVLVLATATFALGSPKPRPAIGRIVGGSDVEIADFPYQVSLQSYSYHYCGGVIVSPSYVLTAAHCVADEDTKELAVRVGSTSKTDGGEIIAIDKIIINPDFDGYFLKNDIALVHLEKEITNPVAVAAALPEDDVSGLAGSRATVVGWGKSSLGGPAPDNLQAVNIPIIGHIQCERIYSDTRISDNEFCGGLIGTGGRDFCQGDGGSAVIIDGVFAGIVSWGRDCEAAEFPAVFTNVRKFVSWIKQEADLE